MKTLKQLIEEKIQERLLREKRIIILFAMGEDYVPHPNNEFDDFSGQFY